MKKPFPCRRRTLWVAATAGVVALLLPVLPSCWHTPPCTPRSTAHYAEVDSLMKSMEDVDSIAAMVEQYRSQKDATGEMLALKRQGSRLRKLSRYDEAIAVHNSGMEVAIALCDTLEMIAALNNIATDYRRKGELSKANGYHYEALKLSDVFSDHDSPEAIKSRVVTLNGIGNIELNVCNYTAADSVLHMALEGERRLDSKLGMAINYANIGAVKHALGNIDSAWIYYRQADEYNRLAGSQEGEALCHLHYGELYEEERNLPHAKEEYKVAYNELKKLGESYHWLEACLPLARVCIMLNEQDEARQYLQEAENEAVRTQSLEHQSEAYEIHYQLAMMDGEVQQALDYYVRSKDLYDSIYGLQKSDEMRRQRIDYQAVLKSGKMNALNNDISRLKRMRNLIALLAVAMVLMAAGIIAALVYAVRVRSRTQRKLRQVEETRSLFFTNVVHQLRTPLTAIMGATDGIIGADASGDDAARRENIEIIERQGKNLIDLVDRILQVGDVRSTIHEPEWRSGDPVPLVRMVAESYRETCMERHIEMTYTHQGAAVTIDTFPSYLITILRSFIENAINYSKDYSRISIQSHVEKDRFIVDVIDDGIGIAPKDLPHVFEPFYRGAVAEHMVDGVGIGLTVARDMAMAIDGQVSASSDKDNGTCFTVSLPLKHGNAVKQSFDSVLRPVTTMSRRLRERSDTLAPDPDATNKLPVVLVVEDHADVAHLVGKVLGHRYAVAYAADGEQALEKISQLNPDLIITDVKMPMMDGHELCQRVRASVEWRDIPIIMLSARTAEADRVRGIEVGADAYLVKPFSPEELLAWVNRLLESRRMLLDERMRSMAAATVKQVPSAQGRDAAMSGDDAFLDQFRQEVEKVMNKGMKLDLDKIALAFRMGESQLRNKVQQLTGKSMTAYVTQLRMERAMHLLKTRPDLLISDVAEQCGFLDVAYFSRVFRQHYGITPTMARNGSA